MYWSTPLLIYTPVAAPERNPMRLAENVISGGCHAAAMARESPHGVCDGADSWADIRGDRYLTMSMSKPKTICLDEPTNPLADARRHSQTGNAGAPPGACIAGRNNRITPTRA